MQVPSEENLNSNDSMPEVPIPDIIQQTDLSGKQILRQSGSWLSSLCNCFRISDSSYTLQKDTPLLDPQPAEVKGKNTLILDLDETLIHSSFTEVKSDILLNIEVNSQKFKVFVLKRPGLEEFLQKSFELFEVVVFTASLSSYADPLLNIIDPQGKISFRLFRESCSCNDRGFVKDLARLGRDLKKVVIVDNSPNSYLFQPNNAIPIRTWLNDKNDRELESLWHILEEISESDDIPKVLSDIKTRSKDLELESLKDIIVEDCKKRAEFNSPVNSRAGKFEFKANQ